MVMASKTVPTPETSDRSSSWDLISISKADQPEQKPTSSLSKSKSGKSSLGSRKAGLIRRHRHNSSTSGTTRARYSSTHSHKSSSDAEEDSKLPAHQAFQRYHKAEMDEHYSPRLDHITESESEQDESSNLHTSASRRDVKDVSEHSNKSSRSSRRPNSKLHETSKGGTARSRRRSSGVSNISHMALKAITSPSSISLISAVTTGTSSSSGSNATVTQHSYGKSSPPLTGKTRQINSLTTDTKDDDDKQEVLSPRPSKKQRDPAEQRIMKTANVFRYLEAGAESQQLQPQERPTQDHNHKQEWEIAGSSSDESKEEQYDSSDDHSSMTDATSVTKSSSSSPEMGSKSAKMRSDLSDMTQQMQVARRPFQRFTANAGIPSSRDHPPDYHQPTVETAKDEDEEDEDEDEDEDTDDDDDDGDDDLDEVKVGRRWYYGFSSDSGSHGSSGSRIANKSEEDESTKRIRRMSATAHSHIFDQSNAPFHNGPRPRAPSAPPRAPSVPPRYAPPPAFSPSQTTFLGYELLASKICSSQDRDPSVNVHPHPIYRKFEAVQHRILLYVQDEISELEEYLRQLDEAVAQTSRFSNGTYPTASRRRRIHYEETLERQRLDVLSRLVGKVSQYSQVLANFKSITQSHPTATPGEIASYKAWLELHAPIEEAETRFLEHPEDLMRITASLPSSTLSSSFAPRPFPEDQDYALLIRNAVLVGPISGIAAFLCLQFLSGTAGIGFLVLLSIAAGAYLFLQYRNKAAFPAFSPSSSFSSS